MSGITGVSGYNASLLPLLSQAESGSSDTSLLDSLVSSGLQPTSQNTNTLTTSSASSSDLQDQIQSAVTTALQSAEQSGSSDLKGVVYNTLVQVLQNNGIDPKTLQPTSNAGQSDGSASSSGSQQSVGPTTSAILAQVLTALSSASAASNPLAQLTSSEDDSQGSSDLTSLLSNSPDDTDSSDLMSLLSTSQSDAGSSNSLSQFLALENDSQGSADLSSLLSAVGSATSGNSSQNSGNLLSSLLPSQDNNQNLLGFLYDSGQ
ncbi:MAG: hypothetical protein ABSG53_01970 [Thermoguttaceae bacterium]|jgi:hypothetical protein